LRAAITPRTRLFILNSPSNPTGSLYSREEIKALGDICVEKGVLIMSDEIYEKLVYDGATHRSVAGFSQAHYDHTIVVHGFAKAYSMTGWRLGYLAAPEPIAKAPEPTPVSEPTRPVENKILENESAAPSASNQGTVVPTQPPQRNEPVLPAPNGSSQTSESMNKENNPQFETLVHDVAQIIFGDNAPDINVRLVRMALEQVWKNRSELQSLDAVAREIARIIFGESNTSDLNVRLVKMALERSNSIALFKAA